MVEIYFIRVSLVNFWRILAVSTLEDALSGQTDNVSMAVFILRTHYPTGRTWANICSSSGYASLV